MKQQFYCIDNKLIDWSLPHSIQFIQLLMLWLVHFLGQCLFLWIQREDKKTLYIHVQLEISRHFQTTTELNCFEYLNKFFCSLRQISKCFRRNYVKKIIIFFKHTCSYKTFLKLYDLVNVKTFTYCTTILL